LPFFRDYHPIYFPEVGIRSAKKHVSFFRKKYALGEKWAGEYGPAFLDGAVLGMAAGGLGAWIYGAAFLHPVLIGGFVGGSIFASLHYFRKRRPEKGSNEIKGPPPQFPPWEDDLPSDDDYPEDSRFGQILAYVKKFDSGQKMSLQDIDANEKLVAEIFHEQEEKKKEKEAKHKTEIKQELETLKQLEGKNEEKDAKEKKEMKEEIERLKQLQKKNEEKDAKEKKEMKEEIESLKQLQKKSEEKDAKMKEEIEAWKKEAEEAKRAMTQIEAKRDECPICMERIADRRLPCHEQHRCCSKCLISLTHCHICLAEFDNANATFLATA